MRHFVLPLLLISQVALADEVTLEPVADNSIYSDYSSNSNGGHEFLYIGVTKFGAPRRALIRFDVSSIPTDATIESAELSFYVERSQSANLTHTLHRLTTSWGEGTINSGDPGGMGFPANDGDATWLSSAHNEISWTTPGGDYQEDVSGQGALGFSGTTGTLSGEGMIADIQFWMATPASNYGWIVLGAESEIFNAKRVLSRESEDERRPKLTIVYTVPGDESSSDGWIIH